MHVGRSNVPSVALITTLGTAVPASACIGNGVVAVAIAGVEHLQVSQ